MTTTIKDATAAQEGGAIAVIEQHRRELSDVLPSHLTPDTWLRVAMGAVRKSVELWKACNETPGSMMNALMEAARLGLEPGTDEYYLTPRRNKKTGKWEVLGITGYQGEIELIYRAGAVSSVVCYEVCEFDEFDWRPGHMDRPTHRPTNGPLAWFTAASRGKILGCYAYALMRDTGAVSEVVIVNDERIKRAMDASATADASHSPWQSDYRAMVLKTGAHDLSKWVPTSAEYRREQLRAAATVAAENGIVEPRLNIRGPQPTQPPVAAPPPPADYIDGEVVPPPEQERPADPSIATTTQRNRLFALLRDGAVSGSDRALRLRIVTRILNRPPAEPVTSFDQLSAPDIETVNSFLQRHKDAGDLTHTLADLGAPAPPDATPVESPPTATGGDQK